MMNLLFGKKNTKAVIIVTVVLCLFLFIIFPICANWFENKTTSEIITTYGVEGTSSASGGNNYVAIDDKETEELVKKHLEESGLWHTSIKVSNETQVVWYKQLSKKLEETYIQGTSSKNTIDTQSIRELYRTSKSCKRTYEGDYSSDECDYNGEITNNPTLTTAVKKNETCGDGKKIYKVTASNYLYYKSSEKRKIVGGKILGEYPDVLVSTALANTFTTLEQNKLDIEVGSNLIGTILSNMPVDMLVKTISDWYSSVKNAASATQALNDIFTEGVLFSTFNFMPDSKCTVTDVARYSKYEGEPPKLKDEDGNVIPYECVKDGGVFTECVESCTGEGKDKKCSTKAGHNGTVGEKQSTDGSPDTYYQHVNKDKDGNAVKSCTYEKSGEKWYQLSIDWVCKPTSETPVKCEVAPVKDDLNNILYYRCIDINEGEVKTKIVDPIIEAYEANTLGELYKGIGNVLTEETAKAYVYDMDDDEGRKAAKGLNPKGYKIDEETRNVIAKHIVMEILGTTEGRSAAIADKDGNFYLQSYNRVLNKEQFKDALYNTIFEKDNILRKKAKESGEEVNEDEKYSEKLYGTFYNKHNKTFDSWDEEKIKLQRSVDKSKKKSQLLEIYSTYDQVRYYMKEYEKSNGILGGTTGSGLAQADSSGFRQRTSAPTYSGYWNRGYYGECPWYARGRVQEILANAGSSYNWTHGDDGGTWCDSANTDKDKFKVSRNYLAPKPGSIVSWKHYNKDGSEDFGHVAIVEEVTPTTVTISESFIKLGIYGDNARNTIYPLNEITGKREYNHSIATTNCSKNGCWQRRTLTYEQMKNAGWNNYRFACYIYLLKDEDKSNNGDDAGKRNPSTGETDTSGVASYIVSEFQKGDGIESKVNFYNWVSETEGGTKLNVNMINSSYLSEKVKVTGTIENNGAASVHPGLYIGKLGETLEIGINGKSYSYELCDGCTVPRWIALYKYIESYNTHRDTVLNLISSAGLSNKLNSASQIHTFMRLTWTYGPSGATSYINAMLNAYKKGGNHDLWCSLSKNVIGTDNKELKVVGNYFNMNEMIFTLFTTGMYINNPNYKNYNYYTADLVEKLLNSGYKKLGTGPLEDALKNGQIPTSNTYSDCINYND